MRRRSTVELEINQDRWMVSYADFVTLLFAFFVVMYSISQVNEGKYRVLSNQLIKAFDVQPSAIAPIQVGEPTVAPHPSAIDFNELAPGNAEAAHNANQSNVEQTSTAPQPANLADLSDVFSERFSDLIDEGLLSVTGNETWLELELKSSILFPSASADASLQARAIFEEIATMLAGFENPVQVEGFTDNVPINNRRFKNNWELSSARAASVVRLLANNGVAPTRLSAVGYGEHRPIADNTSEEGRAKNRRVIVMISKQAIDRPSINSSEMERLSTPVRTDDTASNIESDSSNDIEPLTPPQISAPTSEPAPATNPGEPLIAPLQLQGGGLLFTSDPDLPRNNLPAEEADVDVDTQSPE